MIAAHTHRPRRRRIRARAVFVACAVVTVASLASGCGAQAGDDQDPDHRSFSLQGKTLTIDSDDSALDLVPVDGDRVRVTRWFKGQVVLGGDPSVSWTWHDDRLTLRTHCSGVITDCSARHRVEVPRDAAVTVHNADGTVTANGFRTALKIRTDDGAIRVEHSSGPLELATADGSVHALDVTSHQVKASTDDGSIQLGLATVPDRVDAHTEDGATTIALPRSGPDGTPATYRVTASTDDGRVDIGVPRDAHSPHVVSAHSEDGKVTVRNAN